MKPADIEKIRSASADKNNDQRHKQVQPHLEKQQPTENNFNEEENKLFPEDKNTTHVNSQRKLMHDVEYHEPTQHHDRDQCEQISLNTKYFFNEQRFMSHEQHTRQQTLNRDEEAQRDRPHGRIHYHRQIQRCEQNPLQTKKQEIIHNNIDTAFDQCQDTDAFEAANFQCRIPSKINEYQQSMKQHDELQHQLDYQHSNQDNQLRREHFNNNAIHSHLKSHQEQQEQLDQSHLRRQQTQSYQLEQYIRQHNQQQIQQHHQVQFYATSTHQHEQQYCQRGYETDDSRKHLEQFQNHLALTHQQQKQQQQEQPQHKEQQQPQQYIQVHQNEGKFQMQQHLDQEVLQQLKDQQHLNQPSIITADREEGQKPSQTNRKKLAAVRQQKLLDSGKNVQGAETL